MRPRLVLEQGKLGLASLLPLSNGVCLAFLDPRGAVLDGALADGSDDGAIDGIIVRLRDLDVGSRILIVVWCDVG